MKAASKSRYLASLLGLGCLFVLVSAALAWVLSGKVIERVRELAVNLVFEPMSREPSVEQLEERLSQLRATLEASGTAQIAVQVVAFDGTGNVLAELVPGNLSRDWAKFPPVRGEPVRLGTGAFEAPTILFPMSRIPGAVLGVRVTRFGVFSRAMLRSTVVFGAWVLLGCALISRLLLVPYFRATAEIERLLAKLRDAEGQRTRLLQEISHDTRTPLTAARTSLEMVHGNYDRISDVERRRCVEIAHHEVLYLHELIDALFFLAEMDEPRHQAPNEIVDVRELVTEEMRRRRTMSDVTARALHWELDAPAGLEARILGVPHLLQRLVRNALDNAARHAEKKVEVTLSRQSDGRLLVTVVNDGALVSEESVRSFGQRRPFQKRSGSLAGGQSLGLGSVIMQKIAALHDGELRFSAVAAGGARLDLLVKTTT